MSDTLTVGSTALQTTIQPWSTGDYYWPNTHHYNSFVYTYPPKDDGYANEVEVEQTEHDATLRFYRRTGKAKNARTLVREITVPLGVLEWLQGSA